MRITFDLNQSAALRAGYDAPDSTVKIDVDPAMLTEAQRDALADSLCGTGHLSRLRISQPTIAGVIAAIDAKILARDKEMNELNARAQVEPDELIKTNTWNGKRPEIQNGVAEKLTPESLAVVESRLAELVSE